MNRTDLQKLANSRIREAQILFKAGEYSGAYYLAGYSVECALKACFAKGVKRFDFPEKSTTNKVHTHDLEGLVELANLKKERFAATQINKRFEAGWNVVFKWTEQSRYSTFTRDDADAILDAITRTRDGVLPWIKQRW
ncbi:MAG TPA: HEPN domain-containing protein [Acidobacteriaceae bacterium]|jgi:HEPN domain-containing protein|nr:HEPN domain-containing protein [Acidobacteriaceae bacterium]